MGDGRNSSASHMARDFFGNTWRIKFLRAATHVNIRGTTTAPNDTPPLDKLFRIQSPSKASPDCNPGAIKQITKFQVWVCSFLSR